MTLVESAGLLRAFAWARLGLAGVLLVTVPLAAPDVASMASASVLPVALLVTGASSAAILVRRAMPHPRRIAALVTMLDVVLVTALVAATGGPRSIYPFLYVLCVTAACVLLSRAGGLAVAGVAALLYSGLVLGRTVFPLAFLFESPQETSALEVVTMFLNAATFLTVAIVAGGVAERYRATHRELQTRQRDLRDLEAFRDLVFDCVGTGVVVLDLDHRVTAFNRAAAGITGRVATALRGTPWAELVGEGVDLPQVAAALDDPAVASVRRETVVRRPDGDVVPVLMTFSSLRSAAGQTLGLIAACEDLSALRAMEARVRQSDRLATLGRMSANIAHEIRNPLASMTGAIEALTGDRLGTEERGQLTSIVLRESERLNRIVTDFLAYARPTPLAARPTDVAAVVDEVLVLLEHRPLPIGVKLVRAYARPLWALADPGALRQALWNLCLNAVQAMPAG
ncbi:MAG TPA: histidine kinase dimerization/phospho-acceptor domain-containing protein, partial [Terriglobales bacterium]|nr:histidine kinase dimerization/phospho-acceptor domain-containing protein [Terriglobales bacterium]